MNIGDMIPATLGVSEEGKTVSTSDYKGRKLILYFYPKDNTPGCTAEACSLRDHYDSLRRQGYEVVGVSADSQASHARFKEKYGLPFTLISDAGKSLIEQMGCWGEKKMCGRTGMGILRTTFVVDEEGRIERIFTSKEIKTKIHAEQILG